MSTKGIYLLHNLTPTPLAESELTPLKDLEQIREIGHLF
jgi:hypothetical protein